MITKKWAKKVALNNNLCPLSLSVVTKTLLIAAISGWDHETFSGLQQERDCLYNNNNNITSISPISTNPSPASLASSLTTKMESIRAQLAFTQGELTERDTKFRQLKVEHRQAEKSWSDEKSTLEARIALLEAENQKLRSASPEAAGESNKRISPRRLKSSSPDGSPIRMGDWLAMDGQEETNGVDKVTVPRSQIKQAEAQFNKMTEEVAKKTKLCKALEMQLAQSGQAPAPGLNDEEAVIRWNQLRDQIRVLSLEHLNTTFSSSLVSDKYKDEFKLLSPHWKTYTSTPSVTSYLFRALIWRYILRYFVVPCRACGREVSKKVGETAQVLLPKLSDAEYQDWCIRTATLVHKVYPIDKSLVDELAGKIAEAVIPLVAEADSVAIRASLQSIVTAAAELSAVFDRSRVVVLMHDQPGSTRTHGFPFADKLMDLRAKLGSQEVVDLMITPTLLKKDADYSVLVKAEVTC